MKRMPSNFKEMPIDSLKMKIEYKPQVNLTHVRYVISLAPKNKKKQLRTSFITSHLNLCRLVLQKRLLCDHSVSQTFEM